MPHFMTDFKEAFIISGEHSVALLSISHFLLALVNSQLHPDCLAQSLHLTLERC